jgi:hypothetical protein
LLLYSGVWRGLQWGWKPQIIGLALAKIYHYLRCMKCCIRWWQHTRWRFDLLILKFPVYLRRLRRVLANVFRSNQILTGEFAYIAMSIQEEGVISRGAPGRAAVPAEAAAAAAAVASGTVFIGVLAADTAPLRAWQ